MTVSLTAIIRGFRVPVAVLDRFLVANGLTESEDYAPFYHGDLDDASKLLRAKVGGSSSSSSSDNNKTRLFIPYRTSRHHSPFAYVAYDWLFVHAQRKLHLPEELPNTVPGGFAALRDEILGFAAVPSRRHPPRRVTTRRTWPDCLSSSPMSSRSDSRNPLFKRQVEGAALDRQSVQIYFSILTRAAYSPIFAAPTAAASLVIIWRK